jgi:hypothetical protein
MQYDGPEAIWGREYGGVTSLSACSALPAELRPGCRFRWDFGDGDEVRPASGMNKIVLSLQKVSFCLAPIVPALSVSVWY